MMLSKRVRTSFCMMGFLVLSFSGTGCSKPKVNLDQNLEGVSMTQIRDPYQVYEFVSACGQGDVDEVKEGLSKGIHPDSQTIELPPALILAAGLGETKAAELLLENGAQIECRNEDGMTPLMLASLRGHHKMIRLLLDSGADPNSKLRQGQPMVGSGFPVLPNLGKKSS